MSIPRLRGRTGQSVEGEHKDKWFYEITLWDFSGENQYGAPFQFGPFETEKAAKDFGWSQMKDLSQHLEKKFTGKVSGNFFDLKNGGVLRPWEEQ